MVSTSLISITNDLLGFRETSWIVMSYLLTYTGTKMLLPYIPFTARSDVLSRLHNYIQTQRHRRQKNGYQ